MTQPRLTIDASRDAGPLPHFWRATGFANAAELFNPSYRRQLRMAASISRRGIEHVRIHRLLNLVTMTELDAPAQRYDFGRLDDALDFLVEHRLKPFFELMGNPSERFTDFTDDAQLHAWKALVTALARHLIDRYGEDEAASWYFETWNEPDCETWWRQFFENPTSLCHYYDACSEGLLEASPRLRMGGPGGQGNLNDVTRTFLAHIDAGTNYFTGVKGQRIDFISFHEKAAFWTDEDIDPDLDGVMTRERRFIDYIREQHPRLAGVPVMNGEADPQIGWNFKHSWHATAYYPGFAARMIDRHLTEFIDDPAVNYELLLNDNGFVGSWGQRTLTHCVRPNPDAEPKPDPKHFELLPKPIFHLMPMLSRLGERRCAVSGGDPERGLGAIATTCQEGEQCEVAVLLYNHRDALADTERARVNVRLRGLPFGKAVLNEVRLTDEPWDAFTVWQRMNALNEPSASQVDVLRLASVSPETRGPRPVVACDGRLDLEVELPCPGVVLLVLSEPSNPALNAIEGLTAERCRGAHGQPQALLQWRPQDTREAWAYRVTREFDDGSSEPWRLFHACGVFPCSGDRPEKFTVCALNPWGIAGPPTRVEV